MAPLGHAALFAAFTRTEEPIAFVNCARFDTGANYNTGCSRTEALRCGANYLVLWEAIRAAKSEGLRWFEVGAIFPFSEDQKQQGLTRYKTKFGGEAHRFFRCEMPLHSRPPVDQPGHSAVVGKKPVAPADAIGSSPATAAANGRRTKLRARLRHFLDRFV
jgi:hypothetical protein